jgi:hypothetical protein
VVTEALVEFEDSCYEVVEGTSIVLLSLNLIDHDDTVEVVFLDEEDGTIGKFSGPAESFYGCETAADYIQRCVDYGSIS